MRVYFGTYTSGSSEGIYTARLNLESGELDDLQLVAECKNPSFLAISPDGNRLFAVSEISDFEGKKTGAVAAYAVEQDGTLQLLNRQPSGGQGPCHLVTDRLGKHVLVANYGSGTAAVLAIEPDGKLGNRMALVQHEGQSVNARRQEAPHAHSINLDPANRFAFVADLGIDAVMVYRYDTHRGTLIPHNPDRAIVAPGSGPRHFAFHPTGHFAYVINELLSTVTAFRYDAPLGRLAELHTLSTLPSDYDGQNSTAEVQVHPSGRYLYGSNRGHNSIVVMQIDPSSGKLTYLQNAPTGGSTPRNFGIDPSGQFLLAANQATDNVVVFRIDADTGKLTQAGHSLQVPTPVCVKFYAQ